MTGERFDMRVRWAMLVIVSLWAGIGADRGEWGWVGLAAFYAAWVVFQLEHAERRVIGRRKVGERAKPTAHD